MYCGFIDIWYIVLVVPALIFMMITQVSVNSAMNKYGKVRNSRGLTGKDMAETILNANGIYDVHVERLRGNEGDHYNPKSKVIRLSANVYDSDSVTAVGVAAHEAGHAVQHSEGYFPLKIRNFIIPVAQITSWMPFPLLIISVILGSRYVTASNVLFKLAFIILFAGLFIEADNASRRV